MLRNLTISPELDKEDWDPAVITRMIIIAPGAHVSESEIVKEQEKSNTKLMSCICLICLLQ